MKAYIDKDECTGCGLCVSTCPEIFLLGEDNLAEVYVEEIPASAIDAAMESQEDCPVAAITVE